MYKPGGVSDLFLTTKTKSKKEKKEKSGKEEESKNDLAAFFSQTSSSAKKTGKKNSESDASPKHTKRASKSGTDKKGQKNKVEDAETKPEKSPKAQAKSTVKASIKKKSMKGGKVEDTTNSEVKSSTEDESPKKLKRKKSGGEKEDQDPKPKKARVGGKGAPVAKNANKKQPDSTAEATQKEKSKKTRSGKNSEEAQEESVTTAKGKSKKTKASDSTKDTSGEKPRNEPDDPEKVARTVFVGNLSTSTTLKELRKHFRKHGKVESVRLRNVVPATPHLPKKAAAATRNFHPERSATNAFVVFAAPAEASSALASNGTVLGGHHLRVDAAATSKRHDHARSVFVGNLPFEVEEESLRQEFASCGEIQNVRLIRDGPTGLGKGFGYILFKDAASVVVALRLHEASMFGRRVRVFRSVRREKTRSQPSGGDNSSTSRQGSAVAGVLRRQQRSLAKGKPSSNDVGTWGLGGNRKNKNFRKRPTAAATKKRNMAEIFSHKVKQRTTKKST